MNLNNLKIGTRLGLGFGLVLALLAVVVGLALYELGRSSESAQRLLSMERSAYMGDEWVAHSQLNVNRVMAVAKSRADPEVDAYFKPLMAQTTARINELQAALEAAATTAQDKALMAEVATLRSAYIAARKGYFDTLKAGDAERANGLLTTNVLPASQAYLDRMGEFVRGQHAQLKGALDTMASEQRERQWWLIALGVLAVLVGSVAAVRSSLSITGPLRHAIDAAKGIASGDLNHRLLTQRKDEVGELVQALVDMQASLVKVIGQIRQSSDHIGTASAEIASGTQDLANRTEHAASNLEETASSMEELTATVRQSADSARQANQLASTAAAVASRGGEVVSQVVVTMDEINHSSRKIADIIGVIDGIAFQTNILALNAAVEAARAGEQGRGFAVVAGEVRSLAQRSAQAAKEIKDLINASVNKVQSGSQLVRDAGQTMGEIVASVQRVTDIIGEITAASGEQSDGIAQVNVAVNQLDHMTQQNASLVEESTAAAESLRDQALRLTEVVGVFKLGADAAGATPATPKPRLPAAAARRNAAPAARSTASALLPQPRPHAKPAPRVAAPAASAAAPQPELKRPQLGGSVDAGRGRAAPVSDEGDWESF